MSHLIKATDLWLKWERKEISDYALIKEQKNIINELSDEVIRLETENAELIELVQEYIDYKFDKMILSIRFEKFLQCIKEGR